jgi:hypothetical protein
MIPERIELLETFDTDTQIMSVTFDNKQTALMLYSYGDALQFLNKEVTVSFRKDMYNGVLRDFVQTITSAAKVNTFERDTGIKLFAEQSDSNSNICFVDLKPGDVSLNAVMYCADVQYKTSARAHWAELTVLDKMRNARKLRVFDPDNGAADYRGRYVKADVRLNEYGLSTGAVFPVDGEYAPNPDVEIAVKYIRDSFGSDAAVTEFLNASGLLSALERFVDTEPGYLAVRTAVELDLIAELANVCGKLDISAMKRAVLFSKAYLLNPDTPYSREVNVITTVSRYRVPGAKAALVLVDDRGAPVAERKILQSVYALADDIITHRKGGSNEQSAKT